MARSSSADCSGLVTGRESDRSRNFSESDVVEQLFHAASQGRIDPHPPGLAAPVIGGGDGTAVGGETDRTRLIRECLANDLPEVELAAVELRGAGIAEVRIMRPYNDFRLSLMPNIEVVTQGPQGVEHVLITQIPRRHPGAEHGA
jgi:hypothetical protein